jgi:hypothetical protein
MTDKRAIVVHDPTTHPMESYWAKRAGHQHGWCDTCNAELVAANPAPADPRVGHGVSGLFRHEPGEPCVVCGRSIPLTAEDVEQAMQGGYIAELPCDLIAERLNTTLATHANPAPAGLTSTDQLDAEQRGLPIPFANPTPAELNVERLHTALGHVGFGGFSRDNVKAIAAEYARLGSAAEKK